MKINLVRAKGLPLYQQIKEQIKEDILNGLLPPGYRLPSTRSLAQELGVSRISVSNAYLELEADGYLTGEIGRGTYVNCVQTKQVKPDDLMNIGPPWQQAVFPEDGLSDRAAVMGLVCQAEKNGRLISFASGLPSAEFFPIKEFQFALNDVFANFGNQAFQYDYPEGHALLRRLIAKNHQAAGCEVGPDNVMITAGAQQAIDLICRALVQRGQTVITEDPTYGGALVALRLQGARVVGVGQESDGIDTVLLERAIREHHPVLLYLMSSFHNPTGVSMSLKKKREVLAICGKYRLPILDDNSHDLLYYGDSPEQPLISLDREQLVISISSYSKVFLPGIRLGYMVAPPNIFKALMPFKQISDTNTSPLIQRVVYHYLQGNHYQKNLLALRGVCLERRDVMHRRVRERLPKSIQCSLPEGGSYLWLRGEEKLAVPALYYEALRQGVAIAPGSLFYLNGDSHGCFRLNFVLNDPKDITLGIERLARAFQIIDVK